MRTIVLITIIVGSMGCGSPDPEPHSDAEAGDAGDAGDANTDGWTNDIDLLPPEPPAFLSWEPCPEGWYLAILDGRAEGVICDVLPQVGLGPCPWGVSRHIDPADRAGPHRDAGQDRSVIR